MNAVVPFDPQVPAFLRNEKYLQLTARMDSGLSSGAPPRISFRASRFRFVAADGTETPVTENGGTTLDVIVLDAGEGLSKFYYDRAYDPNVSGPEAAPACFSENGIAPSARSPRPQSSSCASCPHNAWGSKITPSGSKVKACGDVKKLAVIPVNNLGGDAYMLGIPGASLKSWSDRVRSAANRGIPILAVVIRLGFDTTASFPKLTFEAVAMVTQPQFEMISDLIGSAELDELLGRNDTPHPGPFALETAQGGGGAYVGPTVVSTPQPVGVAPIQAPPGMQVPQHTQQAIARAAAPPPQAQAAPQPQPQQDAPAPTRRRGRPSKAAAEVPAQQAMPPQAAPAPAAAAPVASVASVAQTSPEMDSLLDKIMSGKK